jgi:hypothetical protein
MEQRLPVHEGRKYNRYQGDLGGRTAMDDARAENIKALLGIAEEIL